jgi:hypothetical protein
MKIDLEHLHYWMNAIRESKDHKRTLDAFWRGQISSKSWLVDNLVPYLKPTDTVEIHGGWVGVLASMLFQSETSPRHIVSIDLDPTCEPIATMMNKIEEMDGRFRAITGDMCEYPSRASVIVNTSCEHITQEQYDSWLSNLPSSSLIVLQSNNYRLEEHVRTADTQQDFIAQSHLQLLWSGQLSTPGYQRWMLIGKK